METDDDKLGFGRSHPTDPQPSQPTKPTKLPCCTPTKLSRSFAPPSSHHAHWSNHPTCPEQLLSATQPKSTTSDIPKDDKSKLSEHQIAALMGYCGVRNPADLPPVWKKWEEGSSPMAWRSDLMELLKAAAKKLDITLERNLFFPTRP